MDIHITVVIASSWVNCVTGHQREFDGKNIP